MKKAKKWKLIYPPPVNEDVNADVHQSDEFDACLVSESLDASETDEDVDEGLGDGKIGRGNKDVLGK